MWFIQIGFLAALTALAIPIAIHLIFRPRPRRAELGTLRFLQVVFAKTARRRRIMRWLLLTLRLACVVLIALLFARPYWLRTQAAAEKQTTVVLIDQSATMDRRQDGSRLIEQAIAEAKKSLTLATSHDQFAIAFFDHAIHPLTANGATDGNQTPQLSAAVNLLDKLAAPQICFGGTDYGEAMEWARDTLIKAPPGRRRLVIFTDFQRSGLAWTEVDSMPADVATELHDLGRAAVNNLAVVEARCERTWLRSHEQTTVHATIYNGGPFIVDDLPIWLRLTSGGKTIELRERVKIEAGASESVRFEVPALASGLWQGSVAIDAEDDLPLDDKRHIAILASPPYQVLLIDGHSANSPVLAATYFVETALRLARDGETEVFSPFEPRRIGADEILPDLAKYQVVVLADVGEISAANAGQLKQFVERGGGLLIFSGDNLTAASTKQLAAIGLMPGTVLDTFHATDLPHRLKTWDVKHPIFAAFSDPQLGDLARLAFTAYTHVNPTADAHVLASFRSGPPAVIERQVGRGSVVFLAITADRSWSDWTSSRLYLPLVYQLLGHQTGLTAGGPVRQVVLEHSATLSGDETLGIHEREGYTLVVNTSPREAETDRCASEEFVSRFGLKLASKSDDDAAPVAKAAIGSELLDSELWPWLAGVLLVGLVIEGLIANRTVA